MFDRSGNPVAGSRTGDRAGTRTPANRSIAGLLVAGALALCGCAGPEFSGTEGRRDARAPQPKSSRDAVIVRPYYTDVLETVPTIRLGPRTSKAWRDAEAEANLEDQRSERRARRKAEENGRDRLYDRPYFDPWY